MGGVSTTGGMTSEEALRAAVSTWPEGVRPVVHWSESQGGKIAHAHSVSVCFCVCMRLSQRVTDCSARQFNANSSEMEDVVQDYIGQQGRLNLHGMDADLDVMVESKAKELSLLLYRCDSQCHAHSCSFSAANELCFLLHM